jgi:hypothetical protein
MYLANGKIAMILCGTQKVIDALEAQGFKKDVVSKIAPHVTVLPLVDDTFLNEKNALPIAEGGLAKWFVPIF